MAVSTNRNRQRIRYALVGFFVVVGLVAGIGLYRLGFHGDHDRTNELFRFSLTLVEVAGVGGIATLLVEESSSSLPPLINKPTILAAERRRIEDQCRQVFFESRKAYDT